MFISFIGSLGMAAVAKPMITLLIGEKWLQSVEFLQIICFSGMMYPLHAINLNMLQVQGRSDLFLRLEIIKKIVALGPLCLGIFGSIYWMLIGSVFAGFFAYYLNSYYSGKKLNYSAAEQVRDILPSFGVAITMAVIVYAMSYLDLEPIILLPLQIITGAVLTILLCVGFKNEEFKEIKGMIFSFLHKQK